MDSTMFSPAPLSVFPGRLSVSRTIGDIEAKSPKYDGLPNIIIPTPEVSYFKISHAHDFMVLGCDGIYDRMENEEIIKLAWQSINEVKDLNEHAACGRAVELIVKGAICKRTLDNVTAIIIAFESFLSKEKNHIVRNMAIEAMRRNNSADQGHKGRENINTKYRNYEESMKQKRVITSSTSKKAINSRTIKEEIINYNSFKNQSMPSSKLNVKKSE